MGCGLQPDMLRLRVRATEAVGMIVGAVGMEVLGGSLQDFVAAALQARDTLPDTHFGLFVKLHSHQAANRTGMLLMAGSQCRYQ